jgi:hypothetical protein
MVRYESHHACQSFCLSVQTAAISSPAPSAAFSKKGSLLTGWILHALIATSFDLFASIANRHKKAHRVMGLFIGPLVVYISA